MKFPGFFTFNIFKEGMMNVVEKEVVSLALKAVKAELAKITPDQEQAWADEIKAKIGGTQAIDFIAVKTAVDIVEALANTTIS